MTDDPSTPISIEGVEVGKIRLADETCFPNEVERRQTNLSLGVVQLPSLLGKFKPRRPMPPQERFLVLLQAFVTAMNGGRRSPLDETALARLYVETHGTGSALAHQVYRASGQVECGVCGKTYQRHPVERTLVDHEGRPFINRLCNGDLVKL